MNIESIITLIIVVILFGVFLFIGIAGIEKHEKVECIKWQQEAIRFESVGWYPNEWMKEQCLQYDIEL